MRFLRIAMLFAALGALIPGMTASAAPRQNWNAAVSIGEDGTHILGNPSAKVKLTEFVSYTCPHCATFHKEAEAPMRLAYVSPGTLSVKVHHVIRDPVDLTVAMLTNCGDPAGFFKRHDIFMQTQEKWLARMGSMTSAQRQRWSTGELPARFRAIASDFDFYQTMAQRGYNRVAVDQCLADMAMAKSLVAQTNAASELGITGTPSFALDGTLLAGTHDWKALDLQIKARM